MKMQKHSIHENASENIVCEMAVILSRGRWANPGLVCSKHGDYLRFMQGNIEFMLFFLRDGWSIWILFLQTKTYSVKTMAADDQARARVMVSTETILN